MLYKVLNETKNIYLDGKKYVVKDGKVRIDRKVDLPFLEVVQNDSSGIRKDVDKRSGSKDIQGRSDKRSDPAEHKAGNKATKTT